MRCGSGFTVLALHRVIAVANATAICLAGGGGEEKAKILGGEG